MSYFADGTVLRRPTVAQWLSTRKSSFGDQATLGDARRQKQWLTFGWLDLAHPFPIGACPKQSGQLIELAAQNRVDQSRGFHSCPFCPTQSGMKRGTEYESRSSGILKLGSACIEVPDAHGRVWKAPDLVLHYIRAHGYLPPSELGN